MAALELTQFLFSDGKGQGRSRASDEEFALDNVVARPKTLLPRPAFTAPIACYVQSNEARQADFTLELRLLVFLLLGNLLHRGCLLTDSWW